MNSSWHEATARCAAEGTPWVLATVLATTGSTPRAAGSKMVITADAVFDTIGGGQLEQLVTERGRQLLQGAADSREITHFPLAAAALQCCGGSMTVLLESFGLSTMHLCIFGAGHVGRRVALLMQELQCVVTLVDSRSDQLEQAPGGVRRLGLADPLLHIPNLGRHVHVLVMTHDHLLDYQLMLALLRRPPCRSLGLIGSNTKWDRFRERLLADGVPAERLDAVRCPAGRVDIPGKEPMAVAIAIAAQLLQQRPGTGTTSHNLHWRQIRSSLVLQPAGGGSAVAGPFGDRSPA